MRQSHLSARLAGLLVCFAGLAFPQTMIEHAVTAAGGSAAGAAGKGVSEGVEKIFRKIDEQARKATKSAGVEKPKTELIPAIDSGVPPLEVETAPAPARKTAVADTAPRTEPAPRRQVARQWTRPAPQSLGPEPTLEELTAVETGTTRKALVARLGIPSARVIIPEEGQLREVYHFSTRGVHLGTVRLTNGEVNRVDIDPMAK